MRSRCGLMHANAAHGARTSVTHTTADVLRASVALSVAGFTCRSFFRILVRPCKALGTALFPSISLKAPCSAIVAARLALLFLERANSAIDTTCLAAIPLILSRRTARAPRAASSDRERPSCTRSANSVRVCCRGNMLEPATAAHSKGGTQAVTMPRRAARLIFLARTRGMHLAFAIMMSAMRARQPLALRAPRQRLACTIAV